MAKKSGIRTILIPQTVVEANNSLFRIGEIDRLIDTIETALATEIARLRKEADEKTARFIAEREGRFIGLEQFAEANRATLLPTEKKSVELSAGTIGWRFTPCKVTLGKGGEQKAIATLKELFCKQYIRTKESLDKESLLKDRPPVPGIKYTQREEFFAEAKTIPNQVASENVIILSQAAA